MLKQGMRVLNKKGVANLIYFVTNKCNCKCEHCFFWKELNKCDDELTLEEVEKISKTMKDMLYLTLSGGEPFLRQDLPDLVGAFYKNSNARVVVIPTNGTMPEVILKKVKEIKARFKDLNLVVYVSLDDFKEEHDKLRCFEGCFDKAVETLKGLKEIKGISVGTLSTFTASNQDRARDFYNFIREELKPDFAYFNLVRGEPKSRSMKEVDIDKYVELCELIEKDFISGKLRGYKDQWFWPLSMALNLKTHKSIKDTLKKGYLMPCYAGKLSAVLYSNGDVFPCELLDSKLGNLRDFGFDFSRLLDGEKAKEVRKKIKDTKCFCTHECFMNVNLLYNPNSLSGLMVDAVRLWGKNGRS